MAEAGTSRSGLYWAYAFLPFTLPFCQGLGLIGGLWAFLPVAYAFGLTPLLDQLLPRVTENPKVGWPRQDPKTAEWLDRAVLAWLPMQSVLLIATILRIQSASFSVQTLGWILGMGIVAGGGGITVAHELMHRPSKIHRGVAEVLMTMVAYPHFVVEHILGHHRDVATRADPASARLGESLWQFLPRTVQGTLQSAWRLETDRVRAKNLGWTEDRRVRCPLATLSLILCLILSTGFSGLFLWLLISATAIFLLETINYVEHYGLKRSEMSGTPERVQPRHSWNSTHRFSTYYLFCLPRHSDHHYLASRPFFELQNHEDAPQLPAGYPAMVLLATVPPLWMRIMNPKVEQLQQT